MNDYYKTLGVDRQATPDAIKRAYRKLASLYHPDKEGGSKIKFQEVEEAYRTLSDPGKRQQYDNPSPFGPGFGGFRQHTTEFDLDAIFNMFGAKFHQGAQPARRVQMQLWITIQDVALGGPRSVTIGTHQGTQVVEIEIPQGIEDGDNVQYSSIGPNGADLLVIFRVHPNPKYQRHGQNIIMEQIISVWDLILGSTVNVTDLLGNQLALTIPAGTQPGTILRMRDRGLPHRSMPTGDLLIKIQASIPQSIDPELLSAIDKNRSR